MYYVYILECSDKTLYIGTTNDVTKRLAAHNAGKTGAKYTKPRRPVRLVYTETHESKSDALKREWEMKKLTRQKKIALIGS